MTYNENLDTAAEVCGKVKIKQTSPIFAVWQKQQGKMKWSDIIDKQMSLLYIIHEHKEFHARNF